VTSFELHIEITGVNSAILSSIAQHCPLSNSDIKQAIQKGALWLTRGKSTNRLRRIKKALAVNDTLHFYYNSHVLSQKPPAAQLICDFKDYSVWYKPYGLLSQGSKWSDHYTINRYVEQHLTPQRPCFIVHRLDRAATGLMIIAHSKKAAQSFSALFENKSLESKSLKSKKPANKSSESLSNKSSLFEKHYQIIVKGNFSVHQEAFVIEQAIDDKKAKSTFTFKQYHRAINASLVDVKIDTGRKHQIRKHAASIGFPVLGDRLHGNDDIYENAIKENLDEVSQSSKTIDLQLCAVKLAFICPLSQISRLIELPEHLRPNLLTLENNTNCIK
jgi:tRNA pseudouridine32 synthase/23S rRNA pseudouridine746 synthase